MTWLRRFLLAVLVVFGLGALVLTIDGLNDDAGTSDVGIVLGSKVYRSGRPSPSLEARLVKALALYRAGRFATVIVSGGHGREGFDEATVMRTWLVARGVPASAIVVDSQGLNTGDTARNTALWMRAHGASSATVVTQYFHISRACMALEQCGIKVVRTAHADEFEAKDVIALPREVVAWPAYALRGDACRREVAAAQS